MVWQISDLAWFTALAVTLAMRESPIVGMIDGGKQRGIENVEEAQEQIKEQDESEAA